VIDHVGYQLACRARLLTLAVCATGPLTIAAQANGGVKNKPCFVRATGSFIVDGFAVGMELVSSGYVTERNNGPATILAVSDLRCTVMPNSGGLTNETATATLSVGLPSQRVWENVKLDPIQGTPYVEETYSPGTSEQVTIGAKGEIEVRPMYHVKIHVPEGVDILADGGYQGAVIALFAPRTAITARNGDVIRVRGDTGPYPAQRMNSSPGWVVAPVSLPLRLRTANSI
jgi:hypothetical protein